MKRWGTVIGLLLFLLAAGCTPHLDVPVLTDWRAAPPPIVKKIPLNVAILIPEQLGNYSYTGLVRPDAVGTNSVEITYPLGTILKKVSLDIFPSAFDQALLVKNEPYPPGIDAVIIPTFGEFLPKMSGEWESPIEFRAKFIAKISIKVVLVDTKGRSLWNGIFTSSEIKKTLPKGFESTASMIGSATYEAISEALSEAAQQMAKSQEIHNYAASLGKTWVMDSKPSPGLAKPYAEEKPKKQLPHPTIEIIYPLDKSNTKLTEIELKIRIKSEGDIKKISITVNDQESVLNQNDLRRIEEPPSEGAIRGVRTWRPRVALAEGRNVVWVQALDEGDNLAKAAVNVFREGKDTATALKAATKVWLLAVGISQYKDTGLNLSFADKDARAFYQQLTDPEKGLVSGGERAKLLLNEQATRINMVEALTHIFKQAFDEDLVILYFAMHGMVDPDGSELFFIASDTNPHSLAATGVSQLEIERAITKSKAGKVLMIVDTCHSGTAGLSGVFAQRAVSTAAASSQLLNRIAVTKKGMAIFTASSSAEFSQENQKWGGGHGVFTHYLMEGLKGAADENNDKFITLRELYDYTYRRVKEDTKGNQHPEIKGTLDTNIPLAEVR